MFSRIYDYHCLLWVGLKLRLDLHIISDWLMGSGVLSIILTQSTWILENFTGLSFTFTCDTILFDVCRQVNLSFILLC